MLEIIYKKGVTCLEHSDNRLRLFINASVSGEVNSESLGDGQDWEFIELSKQVYLMRSEERSVYVCVSPVSGPMDEEVYETYCRLFAQVDSRSLLRVWNFVPRINDESLGLENYRAFCAGRSRAFEQVYLEQHNQYPAASAVGVGESELIVVALAVSDKVTAFENPLQIPAYRYSKRYSPLPPSFSRACADTRGEVFVSGTASIRASESEGDSLSQQLEITYSNLELMRREIQGGSRGRYQWDSECLLKVYVRHESDFEVIQNWCIDMFPDVPVDSVIVIAADICRAELLVEVEACWSEFVRYKVCGETSIG